MNDLEHTDRVAEWLIERDVQEDRDRAMKARERIIAARRGRDNETGDSE